MKLKYLIIVLCICCMVSCNTDAVGEMTDTSDRFLTEESTSTDYVEQITMETSKPEQDTEQTSTETSKPEQNTEQTLTTISLESYFNEYRQSGNPDPYPDCVPYDHQTDIRFRPRQETFSVPKEFSVWSCLILSIPEDLTIVRYYRHLNLEKLIDGEWVRQAVLDPKRVYREDNAYSESSSTTIRNQLANSSIDFKPSLVEPAITPGQYRFVFYITVQKGETTENRMYYIPFEVAE